MKSKITTTTTNTRRTMRAGTARKQRIAFLFLTLDDPHFPKIWDTYFAGNEDRARIYIHPKFPENVEWRRDRIVKDLRPTEWGRIVEAYMSLFRAAFADRTNVAFVTISESCVPIKPFSALYAEFTKPNAVSWVNRMELTRYDLGARITSDVLAAVGRARLIKHYARMCLVRSDVRALLREHRRIAPFCEMSVGDEFFLSAISPMEGARNGAITFDDWEYVNAEKRKIRAEIARLEKSAGPHKTRIAELWTRFDAVSKSPKTIITVSKTDLAQMRETEAFFYRKFAKTADVEKYVYPLITEK